MYARTQKRTPVCGVRHVHVNKLILATFTHSVPLILYHVTIKYDENNSIFSQLPQILT